MSIIMALDEPFKFLYEDKDYDDYDDDVNEDDICELTVNKGHAIAFTDELFHAGGDNSTGKTIYRLFAYVVSNKKDYPNNMVFTKNRPNMKKLNAARKKNGRGWFCRTGGGGGCNLKKMLSLGEYILRCN